MNVKDVRKAITIIPQNPLLLKGSLRNNLDPFSKFDDQQLEDCLRKSHLWNAEFLKEPEPSTSRDNVDKTREKLVEMRQNDAQSLYKKLKFEIDTDGKNLSVGQRQMICIARALIKNPKILLMDEATSNIDHKTDHMIQKIIKEEFNDTTIITIAHRINTIIFYDTIFVLDQGKIVQRGSPYELL